MNGSGVGEDMCFTFRGGVDVDVDDGRPVAARRRQRGERFPPLTTTTTRSRPLRVTARIRTAAAAVARCSPYTHRHRRVIRKPPMGLLSRAVTAVVHEYCFLIGVVTCFGNWRAC